MDCSIEIELVCRCFCRLFSRNRACMQVFWYTVLWKEGLTANVLVDCSVETGLVCRCFDGLFCKNMDCLQVF